MACRIFRVVGGAAYSCENHRLVFIGNQRGVNGEVTDTSEVWDRVTGEWRKGKGRGGG